MTERTVRTVRELDFCAGLVFVIGLPLGIVIALYGFLFDLYSCAQFCFAGFMVIVGSYILRVLLRGFATLIENVDNTELVDVLVDINGSLSKK